MKFVKFETRLNEGKFCCVFDRSNRIYINFPTIPKKHRVAQKKQRNILKLIFPLDNLSTFEIVLNFQRKITLYTYIYIHLTLFLLYLHPEEMAKNKK